FSRNLPQHWRDARHVPFFQKNRDDAKVRANYHLEAIDFQRTHFALVGNVVALRETMKLARDRSNLEAKGVTWPELHGDADAKDPSKVAALAARRWPEIATAHSDCFACHHDLSYPGFRQERGFGYQLSKMTPLRLVPGRLPVRMWP